MIRAIYEHIKSHLRTTVERYHGDLSYDTGLGPEGVALDSVEILMLLMDLEDAFNVTIPPENYLKIRTIGDLCVQLAKLTAPWDFFVNCKGHSEDVAIVYEPQQILYKELLCEIDVIAERLWHWDVRPKNRVAVLIRPSLTYIVCYFAIMAVGAIPVLVDPNDKAVVLAALKETQARFYLTDSNTDQIGFHKTALISSAGKNCSLSLYQIAMENDRTASTNTLLDQGVLIHYTSGSTGKPCGVVQSKESYLEMVSQYASCMGFSKNDIFLMCLPPFHGFGLSCVMLPALYSGCEMVLMNQFHPRVALELIRKYRISHLYGVPAMYDLLLRAAKENEKTLDTVRYCCSSSLALDPQLISDFYQQTGIVIQQEYGSAETGVISFSTASPIHEGDYSVGHPMQGVSCKIDGQGQLLICSKGIALGYTSGEVFPKWYPTGDKVELINGEVFLRGRLKKLLDIGGRKVSSEEIELVLKRFPGIRQVAVFQMRETSGVGYIGAFICMGANEVFDQKNIIRFCKQNLEDHKIPRKWIPVDEIPLSATGKITSDSIDFLKRVYLP